MHVNNTLDSCIKLVKLEVKRIIMSLLLVFVNQIITATIVNLHYKYVNFFLDGDWLCWQKSSQREQIHLWHHLPN